MKDRVISYLAQGFAPTQVASMCGCSESYVSQVASASAAEIEAERSKYKKKEEEKQLEDRYVRLETRVVSQMEQNLAFAEFGDLTKAMAALIQRRQRTSLPSGIVHDNRTQVVVLQVPPAAIPELLLNERKEVIAVDGKELAALPSPAVRSLFDRLADARKQKEATAQLEEAVNAFEEAAPLLTKLPDDF